MKFFVINRVQALSPTTHLQFNESHIIISIAAPEYPDYKLPIRTISCKDVLYLRFHDVETDKPKSKEDVKGYTIEPRGDLIPFNDNMAKEIIEFVLKYKDDIDLIVVHCDGGFSRSAGTALALSNILNNGKAEDYVKSINTLALYNRFVYNKIINVYYIN